MSVRVALSSRLRTHPSLAAGVSYLVLAVAVLAPSLAPGRTVVPADIVNGFQPWYQATSDHHAHSPLTSDAAFQFYPWLHFLGENVRHGHLPQWNPYLLGGVPFTPNGYVTSYYPPYLLAAVTSTKLAYTLIVLIHLIVAALGTYALGRALDIRPLASWIGGLCAFTALHWIHWSLHLDHASGMALLPAVLAATVWCVMRPGPRRAAVLAILFGLWWLGGGFQYTYYGTLAVAGYAVALLVGRLRVGRAALGTALATLVAGYGLGAALAAPLLLPTARISHQIVRTGDSVGALSQTHLPLSDLLLLVLPDARGNPIAGVLYRGYPYGWGLDTAFFGVVAIVLACVGIATARRRDIAFVVGAVIVLVLAFAAWPHELLYGRLPGYDRFRVSSRWLAVLPAFALPLAARGAESLLAGGRVAWRALLAVVGIAAAVLLAYGGYVASDASAPHRFFAAAIGAAFLPLAAAVVAGWLAPRRLRAAGVLLAAAVLFETGVHSAIWFPHVATSQAYPPLPFASAVAARGGRIVRVAPAFSQLPSFPPDLPLVYGVDDAQGQDVLFPAAYDRYLRTIQDYGTYAEGTNTAPPLTEVRLLASPLLRALDVRTVIADPAVQVPRRYREVASAGIGAYALPGAAGPAVLVPRARPANGTAAWAAVADPGWNPLRSSAVEGLAAPVDGGHGEVTLRSRSTSSDSWLVRSQRGGLLRVSANDAPGWSATLDGHAAPVLRADGIFRSVVVPPGTHRIHFAYRNHAELLGRDAAAGAAALVALLLIAPSLRRRRGARS